MTPEVTFLCIASALSGGERYFVSVAEAVNDHVTVSFAGTAGSPVLKEAERRGLPTTHVDLGDKLSRRTAARNVARWSSARSNLDRFVTERAPRGGVVMQYKWEELLWGGRLHADRVVLLEHGAIPGAVRRIPVVRERLRRAFTSAADVLATSEPADLSIRAFAGRTPTRIPTGVDEARAAEARTARDAIRRELGVDDAAGPVLAYVGRLAENKGVLNVVRLLPTLADARLVVAGAGPTARGMERLATDLGVADRLVMLGYVDDAMRVLAAADVALLLTRDPGEGRPMVVLEAMAVGTPVVGARGSLAMRAAAEGDGVGRVHLVEEDDPASVAATVRGVASAERPQPLALAWDAAARVLLHSLGLVVK